MAQLVIFDTEFTAWPGSAETGWKRPGELKEIIQIGALKIQLKDGNMEVVSSLNILVKPKFNPELSQYIQELTGITQTLSDEHGVDFPSAAKQFYEFVESGAGNCFSWGNDLGILKTNYKLNQLEWPYMETHFIDLRALLKGLGFEGANNSSGELAKSVGLELDGHEHNALYDVKSIYAYLQYQMQTGRLSSKYLTSL